jgi:hypothetical protein
MKTKDSELLLKTLELSTFVVTLYTFSPYVGIAAAAIAIYCLLNEAEDDEEDQ